MFCPRRKETFIVYVRPMQLPETSISRKFYKSASSSNQKFIVSNCGQEKVEKSILFTVQVVLISTKLLDLQIWFDVDLFYGLSRGEHDRVFYMIKESIIGQRKEWHGGFRNVDGLCTVLILILQHLLIFRYQIFLPPCHSYREKENALIEF